MSKLENLLNNEKINIDNIEIPEDMESKLRDTLKNIPNRKRKNIKGRVAAILIVVLLLSYNIDTLAYYGKRIIGYENVMSGTLSELNELGKGQIIDKSYKFKDGTEVILDAVMLDDNNMVLFYTIKDPNGDVQERNSNLMISLYDSFGKYYTYGGQGEANEEETEQRWVVRTHDSPKFYVRSMSLQLNRTDSNGNQELGEISFKIDRNQAVGKSLRIPINKKLELDNRSLKVESLVASPTTTVIKGQIQDIFELGLDYINKDRFRPENVKIKLFANGVEVDLLGSGMSTDMKGINFYITYDVIPEDTKELELKLVSFGGDHDVREVIELEKGNTKDITILDQDINIAEVYEEGYNTYITFTTEENVSLSRVFLNIDGEKTELQETIPGESEKVVEGNSAKIYYTRTMRFNGLGETLELDIQRLRYNKSYDEIIYSYELD